MRIAVAAVAVVFLLAATPAAQATYPGENGKIAFHEFTVDGPVIHTVDPDGSGETLLVADGQMPAWSADGRRIAYSCNARANICTATANGTAVEMLPGNAVGREQNPYWSPDGKHLIFDDLHDVGHGASLAWVGNVWRMDAADGGDLIQMTEGESYYGSWSASNRIAYTEIVDFPDSSPNWIGTVPAFAPNTGSRVTDSGQDRRPDWSPDGAKIVFTSSRDGNEELYVMNADGTAQTRLTTTPGVNERNPTWSPDGAEIAYEGAGGISVMNADGTGQRSLGVGGYEPAWQPVAAVGYPRPAGATPVRVPLVPAFEPCAEPNGSHGTPLAFPSCAPPDERASFLTFGVAPGDGASQSVGHVRLSVRPGDVGVDVSLTDVRRRSDLSDAPGWVELQIPVRITDRMNGMFESTPATVQDTSFSTAVPCSATADTSIGSTCALSTSANAIWPAYGLPVHGGKRSVWELGQISVWDGGEDQRPETSFDNTVLAVQGVFVP